MAKKVHRNHDIQQNLEKNMSNFVVSTVPADDLAPTGARASAGTVMTKFRSLYVLLIDWNIQDKIATIPN